MDDEKPPHLEKGRHVKYWLRCLKTLLPSLYTSNDSNRMYLGYFILSACDLLDILATSTSPSERQDWVEWIYHCQHPKGGFRMWPGTDFGERANSENAKWDPANINATYFALASLLILGDDLKRVHRKSTLRWIAKMQRNDGSFGETLVDGTQEGGRDPRLGYCATGIRYILRGGTQPGPITIEGESIEDIDFDKYIECIRLSETFDGGIADAPFHEPQAGYTFCSLGSLAFLSRLEPGNLATARPTHGPSCPPDVVRWLLSLQTDFTDPEAPPPTKLNIPLYQPDKTSETPSSDEKNQKSSPSTLSPPASSTATKTTTTTTTSLHQSPDKSTMWTSTLPTNPTSPLLPPTTHNNPPLTPTGMCGRPNKPADTCYAFWVGASLRLLRQPPDAPALRSYLLTLTQHTVMGGFSKFPGDRWADLYHSYLGLAALSLASSAEERAGDGVKELDAGMCVSKEARGRLGDVWAGFA